MPQLSEGQLGMYRCPVCSYRDMVELDRTAERHSIECANCGTPLDLTPRDLHSLQLQVQIAELRLPSA